MNGLLLTSKEKRTPLKIIYMNDYGKITERIITVIDFNETSIKAYCYWRKQPRTFSMKNILSVGSFKESRKGA
ncbi:hypothetical protein [Pseudobacillus badius]|uniref:hypothetical protein n=1 Tax=Bacillus badius TaxID=1455 RepID=UPI0024A3A46B|nr:hypothetical protein [Bacillus badius]GLY09613.1 hypothetical protein Bbad01_08290 [Bacillus badius]